jgi:hypothetical protein
MTLFNLRDILALLLNQGQRMLTWTWLIVKIGTHESKTELTESLKAKRFCL